MESKAKKTTNSHRIWLKAEVNEFPLVKYGLINISCFKRKTARLHLKKTRRLIFKPVGFSFYGGLWGRTGCWNSQNSTRFINIHFHNNDKLCRKLIAVLVNLFSRKVVQIIKILSNFRSPRLLNKVVPNLRNKATRILPGERTMKTWRTRKSQKAETWLLSPC